MKCKNLGVVVDAKDVDADMVDAFYTIQDTIDSINDKKRARKNG